jgi:hypothetical protein
MRGSRLVSVLVSAIAAAGLASMGAAQTPDASPDPRRDVIAGALEQLAALDSYRIESRSTTSTDPGREFGTDTVVVRSPEFAMRTAMLADGEPAVALIVIGDDAWYSQGGSPWADRSEVGMDPPSSDEVATSLYNSLRAWSDERLIMELVGPETVDGTPALRYHGETRMPTPSTDPEDPYYRRSLRGTLDLWVDAERGHVLRAVTDLRDSRFADRDGEAPVYRHEELAIVGVDDPANVVEPPDLAVTAPSPDPGDPAMAALVQRAVDALAEVGSYRLVEDDATLGFHGGQRSTIVNGDPPSAETTFLADGSEFIRLVVAGERSWYHQDDGSWEEMPADVGPDCEDRSCAFAMARAAGALSKLLEVGGTMSLVGEETLDGETVLHLRREEPVVVEPFGSYPTTHDVWIAKDGGHLVRWTHDGVGTRVEIRIEGVDDPANVVAAPPSPLASPSV